MQWLLSIVWQFILGRVGLSTDQKLGRAEEVIKEQNQLIKDTKDAKNIKENNVQLAPDKLDDWVRSQTSHNE